MAPLQPDLAGRPEAIRRRVKIELNKTIGIIDALSPQKALFGTRQQYCDCKSISRATLVDEVAR
jgi:hypothetical protein